MKANAQRRWGSSTFQASVEHCQHELDVARVDCRMCKLLRKAERMAENTRSHRSVGIPMDIIFRVLYVLYIVVLYKASSRKFSRRFPTVPEGSGRLLGNSGQNAAQVQRAESLLEESPISLDEFHFLLVSYCPI